MLAAAAIAAPAAQAEEGHGDVRCEVKAQVRLSEGLRLGVPFQTGTLRSPKPGEVRCSGRLGDRTFEDVTGKFKLDGTFGDGPISSPSGGATCTHNDGYIDAKISLPLTDGAATLRAQRIYWLRSAMAVIKASGFVGDAPLTMMAAITFRDGSCTERDPIHVAGFTGVLVTAGNVSYEFDPSS